MAVLTLGCESEGVVVVPSAQLELAPAAATLVAGESGEWRATLQSREGQPLSGRAIEWSTPDPETIRLAATTGERITIEALAPGHATVQAASEGHTATATVEVLTGPSVALSVGALRIEGRVGQPAEAVVVEIDNGGHGALSGLSTRIVYPEGSPSGWLSTGLNGTTAPTSLTVIASAVALPVGTHEATVEVHSPAGGGVVGTLAVTFAVAPPPPLIVLAADAVGLASSAMSPVAAVAEVAITNGGDGTLDGLEATVAYEGGEAEGWLTATLAAAEAPTALRVSAVAEGMPPGEYRARVAVHSPVALVSPVHLTVTFRVAASGGAGVARPASGEERDP